VTFGAHVTQEVTLRYDGLVVYAHVLSRPPLHRSSGDFAFEEPFDVCIEESRVSISYVSAKIVVVTHRCSNQRS